MTDSHIATPSSVAASASLVPVVIGSGALSSQSDRHSVASSSASVSRHASLTAAGSTNAAGSANATPASVAASASPSSLQTSSEQHDSFDDFDEDVTDSSPMQPIGTCVALYPFDGMSHEK